MDLLPIKKKKKNFYTWTDVKFVYTTYWKFKA